MNKMITRTAQALAALAVGAAIVAPAAAASGFSHRTGTAGGLQQHMPGDTKHSQAASTSRFNFGFGTGEHSEDRQHRRHHHHDKLPWPKP